MVKLVRERGVGEVQRRKLEYIENLDLSRPKARMCAEHSLIPEDAERVEQELKRFFLLLVLEEGKPQVISEKIDALWHTFILETKIYRQFCEVVFNGELEHYPSLPAEVAGLLPGLQKTKETYQDYFGTLPPADLWSEQGLLCWGCGGR